MKKNNLRRYIASANHLMLKLEHKYGVFLPAVHPLSAMVELCNVCNLKCPLCPSGNFDLKRPRGFMKEEVFRMIVDQLDDRYTKHFTPVMWGESMLHPNLLALLKYAGRKDWSISISTNGNIEKDSLWYEELVATGVDEIVCAVDGHDQESYSVYRRGGRLDRVHNFLASVRMARDKACRTTPRIVGQIHLLHANEDHCSDIKQNIKPFVDEIRVKKIRTFYTDPSKISVLCEQNTLLKPEKNELRFEGAGRPRCPSMLYSVNINWEGEVLACCKDPENVLHFGNVRDSSLRDIRRSQKYVRMCRELLRGVYKYEICRQCYKL